MTLKKFFRKITLYKNRPLSIIKNDPIFSLAIVIIIVLAIFFRTYNYTDRVFIQADNSRDIQVARYAADHLKIPQIGQFSSAGPFFYGPWYYWFLELVSFLPLGFLTHWYIMSVLYLVFIGLIFWLGKEIGGKWVGALAALFAAISPAQINYSFSTWNPAIVPFLVLISLILLLRIYEFQKIKYIFLLAFFVGLSISIHFQAFLTVPILLVGLVGFRSPISQLLKALLFLTIGFLIPFLPLIYFDWHHNWYNFTSLFVYLSVDQFSIWVPNRWLTFIAIYWPDTWSFIIGGTKYLSVIIISLLSLITVLRLKSLKQNKLFYVLAITFVLELILFRYYRGERYQYYSLFAHPYVLILSAWVSTQLFKIQKVLGIFLILGISFSTLNAATKDLKSRGVTLSEIKKLKTEIYRAYPNSAFDIYGCASNPASVGHPLGLVTYYEGRNSLNGVKIGVCESVESLNWVKLVEKDLQTEKVLWVNVSTPVVYKSTVEWWKEKPPGKGDFFKFIREKILSKCYPHC